LRFEFGFFLEFGGSPRRRLFEQIDGGRRPVLQLEIAVPEGNRRKRGFQRAGRLGAFDPSASCASRAMRRKPLDRASSSSFLNRTPP
jgi:hypothetical protein